MKSLHISASIETLPTVLGFIEEELEYHDCSMQILAQVMVATEEIFVNIAHYAYPGTTGTATVCVEIDENKLIKIQFEDEGRPFNPLDKEDPDISLEAEERDVGGLGIYMVKNTMDRVYYEYKDGKNIFTIEKDIVSG